MTKKLELVRETRLHKLLPGLDKKDRLEASGVLVTNQSDCYVVFDNMTVVARLNISLEPDSENRLIPAPSPCDGFEGITFDPAGNRFYLPRRSAQGYRRQLPRLRLPNSTATSTCSVARGSTSHSRNPTRASKGSSTFAATTASFSGPCARGTSVPMRRRAAAAFRSSPGRAEDNWTWSHEMSLPETAEFEDYAGLAIDGDRVAVVSQDSRRLWLGALDNAGRAFRDAGVVYRFPKSYCNVEGVSWLSGNRIIVVSDRCKKKQKKRCGDKDQSIHLFDIPAE